MIDKNVARELAAILAADMAGYSRQKKIGGGP